MMYCRQFIYISLIAAIISVSGTREEKEVLSHPMLTENAIDLDAATPVLQELEHIRSINVHLSAIHEQGEGLFHSYSDDEDDLLTTSGSGSGSEDNYTTFTQQNVTEVLTPTQTTFTVNRTSFPTNNSAQSGNEEPERAVTSNNIIDLQHTFDHTDSSKNNDITLDDPDDVYDLQGESNYVIGVPNWSQWSDWFTLGITSKVRVRTCNTDREEISVSECEGVRVQIKSCHSTNVSQCDKVQNISTMSEEGCDDASTKLQGPPISSPTHEAPSTPTVDTPTLDKCQYALYDTYRQKYVFTHWNLTELAAKSKAKKWCDKNSGQYIVMSTPSDRCRQDYRNLCKTSEKCQSERPIKDRGDVSDGCWRNLVYGDIPPEGLSGTQDSDYFICQHFAGQSRLGKIFGFKETHYGTLYDTSLKTPVLSLNKITRLGDDTWPDTDYFIEQGLVEKESEMIWLFQKPKTGILTLQDIRRCRDDHGCDLGLRQVLPSDYHDPRYSDYIPAHLMWPELMPPDPHHRLTTFTLTNMAPMYNSLFEEWHDALVRVRLFAIKQCGIPVVFDSTFPHLSDFSGHRTNKSAMFVISGVIPSGNHSAVTGHDIHIPYMFWFAGCCVMQHSASSNKGEGNVNNSNSYSHFAKTGDEAFNHIETKNITAFSLYILNQPDSHVVAAPVLQLEILLRDMYKLTSDLDVTLFPGYDSTCSDLRNDVSKWFQ